MRITNNELISISFYDFTLHSRLIPNKSESSYFSDASNSDFDENLIIPDASSTESEDDIETSIRQTPDHEVKEEVISRHKIKHKSQEAPQIEYTEIEDIESETLSLTNEPPHQNTVKADPSPKEEKVKVSLLFI